MAAVDGDATPPLAGSPQLTKRQRLGEAAATSASLAAAGGAGPAEEAAAEALSKTASAVVVTSGFSDIRLLCTGAAAGAAGGTSGTSAGGSASSRPLWQANLAPIPDVRGAPERVADPPAAVAAARSAVTWTTAERSTFLALHWAHGKDWRRVAAGLPSKSHRDVVRHYYDAKVLLGLGSRFAKSAGATPAARAATFARLAGVRLDEARAAVGPAGARRGDAGGGGEGGGRDPDPRAAGGEDGSSSGEDGSPPPGATRTRNKEARGFWWWFALEPPPAIWSYEVPLPITWAVVLPPSDTWDVPLPPPSFQDPPIGGRAMDEDPTFLLFEDKVWEFVRFRDAIVLSGEPTPPDPPGAVSLPLEMHPGVYVPVICMYVPPWGFQLPPPDRREGAPAGARGGAEEED